MSVHCVCIWGCATVQPFPRPLQMAANPVFDKPKACHNPSRWLRPRRPTPADNGLQRAHPGGVPQCGFGCATPAGVGFLFGPVPVVATAAAVLPPARIVKSLLDFRVTGRGRDSLRDFRASGIGRDLLRGSRATDFRRGLLQGSRLFLYIPGALSWASPGRPVGAQNFCAPAIIRRTWKRGSYRL